MIRNALLAAAALVALGCSSSVPPELRDARTAYERSLRAPNAGFAPADLLDAREWLSRAEKSYTEHGDARATRDLAYTAERLAIAAQANGDAARAERDRDLALGELRHLRDVRVAKEIEGGEIGSGEIEDRAPPLVREQLPSERGARVDTGLKEGINPKKQEPR